MILLIKGDGRLGPSELCQRGEGVNGIHLLLGDAALPAGFLCLGVPEDHEAMISLKKISIVL